MNLKATESVAAVNDGALEYPYQPNCYKARDEDRCKDKAVEIMRQESIRGNYGTKK